MKNYIIFKLIILEFDLNFEFKCKINKKDKLY